MGLLPFFPAAATSDTYPQPQSPAAPPPRRKPPTKQKRRQPDPPNPRRQPSSWDQFKSLLSCKQSGHPLVHDPARPGPLPGPNKAQMGRSTCGSICSFRDVVHGNTRVVHRADNSPENSSLGQEARLLTRKPGPGSSGRSMASSFRSTGTGSLSTVTTSSYSSRGMPLRKLSGCYECHMIVDPSRYPITPRATMSSCSQCGEIFAKLESLEHHQAVRHAVSDLGPEDSGRNIVEIIFKSSWMKKDSPMCKIERILKVHNTPRTLQRFEECRDAVKARATAGGRKNPRCAADGNELLRFHCTPLACALGAKGSSSLCAAVPACGVCTIIRNGFQGSKGVRTTASSGRAHDSLDGTDGRRAMLVCRVIAGRIRRTTPNESPSSLEDEPSMAADGAAAAYDSVAGTAGAYSNLEDLVVHNPRAILPCFVVIYKTLNL